MFTKTGPDSAFSHRTMGLSVVTDSSGSRPVVSVVFILANLSSTDDGFGTYKLRCFLVTSPDGTFDARDTLLQVQDFKEDTLQVSPPSPTVTEHDQVNLTCSADGTPPPTFTWISPQGRTVAHGPSYTIPMVHRDMSGVYTCVVTDGCGRNHTRNATLVVRYKPENTTMVANASSVCIGGMALLKCSAAGKPNNISYTLYRNVTEFASQMHGLFVLPLTTPGVTIFTCVPSNEAGDGHNKSVTVTVKEPPKITGFTPPQTVVEGSNFTSWCNVSGTAPLKIAVSHPNGSVLTNSGSYTFSHITRRDEGTYTCTVNNGNECSNDTNTTNITVNYKPENTKLIPNEHIGCVMDVVSLNCSALANPDNINYTLYRNDTALASNMNGKFIISLNASGLSIFKCVPSNEVGDGENKTGFFTVKEPPRITRFTSTQTEVEGSDVTIRCNASGTEPLGVAIFHPNSSVLTNTGSYTFSPITRRDGGTYTCTVNNGNECPVDTKAMNITVNYKPEKTSLTRLESSYCLGTSVYFNCTATGKPDDIHYSLFVNKTLLIEKSRGVFNLTLNTLGKHEYTCVPNNTAGIGQNSTISIDVQENIKFVNISAPMVKRGVPFTLECTTNVVRPVSITWYKNSEWFSSNRSLIFSGSLNDTGSYSCLAESACNNTKQSERVNITVTYASLNKPNAICLANDALTNVTVEMKTNLLQPPVVTCTTGRASLISFSADNKNASYAVPLKRGQNISCSVDGYPLSNVTFYLDIKSTKLIMSWRVTNKNVIQKEGKWDVNDNDRQQIENLCDAAQGPCFNRSSLSFRNGSVIVDASFTLTGDVSDPEEYFKSELLKNAPNYGLDIDPNSVKPLAAIPSNNVPLPLTTQAAPITAATPTTAATTKPGTCLTVVDVNDLNSTIVGLAVLVAILFLVIFGLIGYIVVLKRAGLTAKRVRSEADNAGYSGFQNVAMQENVNQDRNTIPGMVDYEVDYRGHNPDPIPQYESVNNAQTQPPNRRNVTQYEDVTQGSNVTQYEELTQEGNVTQYEAMNRHASRDRHVPGNRQYDSVDSTRMSRQNPPARRARNDTGDQGEPGYENTRKRGLPHEVYQSLQATTQYSENAQYAPLYPGTRIAARPGGRDERGVGTDIRGSEYQELHRTKATDPCYQRVGSRVTSA
ncbi:hemicentin-1 [Nematostella vectensis]|uniref:hemicentin-1 n=1 Tax=Nematostella vectensis TaxID=45351 RepID=UPI002076D988|nr:hemicentin-1 [Nematostella vectensis]